MKKRIVTVIICILLSICSFWGCNLFKRQTPEEALKQILEKSNEIEDMDLSYSTITIVEVDGEKLETPVNIDAKIKNGLSNDMIMEMKMEMKIYGITIESMSYYADGYYYTEMAGMKVKQKMDSSEILEQTKNILRYRDLEMGMFKEIKRESKGKQQIFIFKGNPDKMSEYLEKIVSPLKEILGNDLKYTVNNMEGSIVTQNDEVIESNIDIDMEMLVDGKESKVSTKSTSKINATGDDVKISFPDFSEYEETQQDLEVTGSNSVDDEVSSGIVNADNMSSNEVVTLDKNVSIGDTVMFGKDNREWIVLDKKDENILLLTKKSVGDRQYHKEYVGSAHITWETCSLRQWLNEDFYQTAFTEEEKKKICETEVKNPDSPERENDGGNDTVDKIFLLSVNEAEKYFEDDDARSIGSWWWLRSLGFMKGSAAGVESDGQMDLGYGISLVHAVRPALWVNVETEA